MALSRCIPLDLMASWVNTSMRRTCSEPDDVDNLTVVWESTTMFQDEVPRSVFLIDKGREAVIFGLEEGSMQVSFGSLRI